MTAEINFFWNRHLVRHLIDHNCSEWIIPVTRGYTTTICSNQIKSKSIIFFSLSHSPFLSNNIFHNKFSLPHSYSDDLSFRYFGFATQQTLTIKEHHKAANITVDLILISRIGCLHAGTRYKTRGITHTLILSLVTFPFSL